MRDDKVRLVTYRIESDLDFQRVVSSLEESDISFTTRTYSDSSFPSIAQSGVFGDITVDVEKELELRSLIESLTNTQPVRVDQVIAGNQLKRKNVWQIILITYAIMVSVVCLRYWYLNYRTSEDKNNSFEWSVDARDLIAKSKETGVISVRSRDANFDQNFELIISYSKKGVRLVDWRDLNEDGYYEEIISYNLKGEQTGIQYDRDNDGMVEEAIMVLEGFDTLKFVDFDKNGVFELQKAID